MLDEERIDSFISLYDCANALHTNSVTGLIRYRNSVFKANIVFTGVCHLQKDFAALFIELYLNGTLLAFSNQRPAGVN